MHLTVYTSVYSGVDENFSADVKDIVQTAKYLNPKSDICGVLIIHGHQFLQILEGDEGKINALMDKITKDPRHSNVDILINQSVEIRSFTDWNMDILDLNNSEELDSETLKRITHIYKENFSLNGKVLAKFYEEMCKSLEDLRLLK